jgi:hypothetical protein
MNYKGCGKIDRGPIRSAVPAIAGTDSKTMQNRTVGILAEILNGHVLNTNQMVLMSAPLPPSFFQSINIQHSTVPAMLIHKMR